MWPNMGINSGKAGSLVKLVYNTRLGCTMLAPICEVRHVWCGLNCDGGHVYFRKTGVSLGSLSDIVQYKCEKIKEHYYAQKKISGYRYKEINICCYFYVNFCVSVIWAWTSGLRLF